jgi:solute carrier family 25 protein 16
MSDRSLRADLRAEQYTSANVISSSPPLDFSLSFNAQAGWVARRHLALWSRWWCRRLRGASSSTPLLALECAHNLEQAKTVVAPLDRVKILFQTSSPDFKSYAGHWTGVFRAARVIYADAGVRGLLQGHSATLVRVFPYAAIKFMTYDVARHVSFILSLYLTSLNPPLPIGTDAYPGVRDEHATVHGGSNIRFVSVLPGRPPAVSYGALGLVSVAFTYPLELIRVRMAVETRHTHPSPPTPSLSRTSPSTPPTAKLVSPPRPTITHVVSLIYREGGSTSTASATPSLFSRFPLLNFYRGITVTSVGIIAYAGTSFLVWDFLRAKTLPLAADGSGKRQGTPGADLVLGGLSGAIAQTASYPFEVVRRRMQVGGLTNPGRWMRWGETARQVWREALTRAPSSASGLSRSLAGAQGFYVGLSIGFIKVVPMNAVSYMVWQAGKRLLEV